MVFGPSGKGRELHAQRTLARRESAVKVGDVALVQKNLPRSKWRLARSEKLIVEKNV